MLPDISMCPKCGQPQPTNGPYLMPCHCEPRTVVFDGTAEMAERVGLIYNSWLAGPHWFLRSNFRSPDIHKGDTLIIDASGRAVGVKASS